MLNLELNEDSPIWLKLSDDDSCSRRILMLSDCLLYTVKLFDIDIWLILNDDM